MNLRFVIVTGYFGLIITLLYFYLSSRLIEKQTPEYIKEKYSVLPKPLWEKVTIAISFATFALSKNEIIDFVAFTVFVAILCKGYVDRNKFLNNQF